MEITVCDFCKKQANEALVNRFIQLRFAQGTVARFLGGTNKEMVVHDHCLNEMIRLIEKSPNN